MPAPTALQRRPEELAENIAADQDMAMTTSLPTNEDGLIDMSVLPADGPSAPIPTISNAPEENSEDITMNEDGKAIPRFAPDTHVVPLSFKRELRKVPIPPHRLTPLKNAWPKMYPPLVEHLKLQCRVNTKSKAVELRTSEQTTDIGALQKGEDFVKAFTLGFDVDDAIALLRLDDLYIETFEIKDVKTLNGDHLARAIGRIAGKDGKTKFAIENASKTRVVLADSKIHILGGFQNIHIARESIVSLILGKTPGKVYGGLRTVAGRMKERF
ncbi:pre-rRNA-processing protein pno1 [Aaosphaeria arxii CBS 175.79]|uniref:Pre-rRNA-processing protein PNO1 n=1 Tax=Aaosphaeria arxii CBS 175.79 TaxID=1450172 RepID=A0A6A5XSM0_9PLEO|nr:pre-rRNA-processing protein pno1 [Aaosphaeria arxii CBS 175.79]KAF2015906.1 pre-rRNA-processing protein pno1 [Aaosphaeria arxii CBS 175.79]